MIVISLKSSMMGSIQIFKQTSVISSIDHRLRISIILHKLWWRASTNCFPILILLWWSLFPLYYWFKSWSSSFMSSFRLRIRRQSFPSSTSYVFQDSFASTFTSIWTFVDDCIFINMHSRSWFVLMLLSSTKSTFHEWMFKGKAKTNSVVLILASFWL